MAKSKLMNVLNNIEETVVNGYRVIEDTVVGGYKKVEDTVVNGYKTVESTITDSITNNESVVGGYKKIENEFVDQFLTKDGETVDEAKKRMNEERLSRELAVQQEMKERKQKQEEMIKNSIEASKNAGKR